MFSIEDSEGSGTFDNAFQGFQKFPVAKVQKISKDEEGRLSRDFIEGNF
jgi:hypothetical protein